MEKYCPKCNANYGETDKNFCPQDRTRLVIKNPEETLSKEISVIKNKIIWNVPVGEIAYRISEAEMDSLLGVSGIVVNEGVTAYIYINGSLAAEIHGGNYDFVSKEELERKLNARFGGIAAKLRNVWKVITRFWVGTSLNEQINDEHESLKKLKSIEELTAFMQKDALCSVVLKLDREFPLIFEQSIKTSHYNAIVGLQIQAQITDYRQFIQYFFMGEGNKQNVSNVQIRDLFQRDIAESLRYINMGDGKVSEEEKQKLLLHLQNQTAMGNTGISITRIKDCRVYSEDLERLRGLDREIYLSEQELERLHKINIIKNRLNTQEIQQRIEQARSERDLANAMDEINRDKILAEEDFAKFKLTIIYARRLREAESQEELDAALEGIHRAQILRAEETDQLLYEIAERKYKRETIFSLMQLEDTIKRDKMVQDAQQEHELSSHNHQIGLERIKDIYRDERFLKEIEHEREKLKLQQEKTNIALDTLKKYNETKEEERNAAHRRTHETLNTIIAHEENKLKSKHEHEENKLKTKATMSAEQLTAEQLAQLSPEAQIEYMKALASKKEAETEREKAEATERMHQEELARIERENQRSREHTESIVGIISGVVREQTDKYKNDLHRQEDRLDRQQEQVIQNMGGSPRTNFGSRQSTSPLTITPHSNIVKCPKCGKENNLADGTFCGFCTSPLT